MLQMALVAAQRFARINILCAVLFCLGDGHASTVAQARLERRISELVAEFESDVQAPQISPRDLLGTGTSGKADVLFVDVRTPEERQVSTIPGAISVSKFEEQLQADGRPKAL
jgi:hypothetical protein